MSDRTYVYFSHFIFNGVDFALEVSKYLVCIYRLKETWRREPTHVGLQHVQSQLRSVHALLQCCCWALVALMSLVWLTPFSAWCPAVLAARVGCS